MPVRAKLITRSRKSPGLMDAATSATTMPDSLPVRTSETPGTVLRKAANRASLRSTCCWGTLAGTTRAMDSRGPGASRRSRPMTRSAWAARTATSAWEALGEATVSMRVAVSPKSLRKVIGPAPSGNPLMEPSFRLMSSSTSPVWAISSRSFTVMTDMPVRVTDSTRSTLSFSATRASMTRVTSSSTFSARTPGQGQSTAATRTGMSGSLRWGILA